MDDSEKLAIVKRYVEMLRDAAADMINVENDREEPDRFVRIICRGRRSVCEDILEMLGDD